MLALAWSLGLGATAYLTRTWFAHPALCRVVSWVAPLVSPYEVHIGSMESDWRSQLTLSGVRVLAHEETAPIRSLELSEVGLRLRLGELVRGDLRGLRSVRVEGGRVAVSLSPRTAPSDPSPRGPVELPRELPSVELRNVDVQVALDPHRLLSLEGLRVFSEQHTQSQEASISVERAALAEDGEPLFSTPLSAQLVREGQTVELRRLSLGDQPLTASARLTEGTLSYGATIDGLELTELRPVLGGARWDDLAGTLDAETHGSLPLARPADGTASLALEATGVAIAGRHLDHVTCRAQLRKGVAQIQAGSLELAGGRVEWTGGSVAFAAAPYPFALDGEAEFTDLAPLGALLGAEEGEWGGALSGSVRVEGDIDGFAGTASLEGRAVRVAGWELGGVQLTASADGDVVRVSKLSVQSDRARITGGGSWRFREEAFEDVHLSGELTRVEELLGERGAASTEGRAGVPGSARADGALSFSVDLDGSLAQPNGRVALQSAELNLTGTPLRDLVLEGTLREGVLLASVVRADTPYGAAEGSCDLTLPLAGRPAALTLRTLLLRRAGRALRMEGPVELDLGPERVGFDALVLTDPADSETRLELGFTRYAGGDGPVRTRLRAAARVHSAAGLLAALWPEGEAAGVRAEQVDLEAALDLGETSLLAEGSLSIGALTPADGSPEVAVALTARLSDDVLSLGDLTVRRGETTLADLTASFPLDPRGPSLLPEGEVRVSGRVELPSGYGLVLPLQGPARTLRGDVSGSLDLAGSWRHLTGGVTLDARRVVLDGAGEELLPAPASLSLEARLGDAVELRRLELVVPQRGSLRGTGDVGGALDAARLASGDIASWGDAPLSFEGAFALDDVGWLAGLTPTLWRTTGEASGTLRVGGTLARPLPEASLRVANGSLKVEALPELKRIALEAKVTPDEVRLERLALELGSSPLEVSGRVGLAEASPAVDLVLRGQDVLLVRDDKLRMRGDLDLRFHGTLAEPVLSGNIALRHSRLSRDVDLLSNLRRRGGISSVQRGIALPSFRDGLLARTRLDLAITTKEPLEVVSNLARGGVAADLHVGGTGEVLVPTGRVFLDGFRVELPGGPVQFQTGLVTFSESNPRVPRVELVGTARLSGYDVQLSATGPYDDLEIVGSSQPPLGTNELYFLVLTGRVPASPGNGAAASQSLGIYLARDLLRRWAGGAGGEGETSFLDRLEIVSGREVSKSGVMTMEVSYRWLDGLGEPGDTLEVVAERDKYEDINMGLRFVFRSR